MRTKTIVSEPQEKLTVDYTPFLICNADSSATNELKVTLPFGIFNAEWCKQPTITFDDPYLCNKKMEQYVK